MAGDLVLRGPRVTLLPMGAEHREAIVAASADGMLWTLPYSVIPGPDTVDAYIARPLEGRSNGWMIPFVTMVDGHLVGSTRFWKIDRPNRKLEIGHTWIAASWQRTFVNTEAKLSMLVHAFEVMNCVRVQFTTDERNTRSQAALTRLGAKKEGILRHERIMPDGHKRNSVRFSIIDDEWPEVKARLAAAAAGAAHTT